MLAAITTSSVQEFLSRAKRAPRLSSTATHADASLAILSIHARKSHCRTYSRRPRRKHLGPRPCARSKSRVDCGKSAYRETSSQDNTGLPIRSTRRCARSSERVLPLADTTVVAPAELLSSLRCRFVVMTRSILLRTYRTRARPMTAREHRSYCGSEVESSTAEQDGSGASESEYLRVRGCPWLRPLVLVLLELSNQFQTTSLSPKACTLPVRTNSNVRIGPQEREEGAEA